MYERIGAGDSGLMVVFSGKIIEKESVEWFGAFLSFVDGGGGRTGTNRSHAEWLTREFHVRISQSYRPAQSRCLPKYTARPPQPSLFLTGFFELFLSDFTTGNERERRGRSALGGEGGSGGVTLEGRPGSREGSWSVSGSFSVGDCPPVYV